MVTQPGQLKAEIDELIPGLIAARRDLHEHPEKEKGGLLSASSSSLQH